MNEEAIKSPADQTTIDIPESVFVHCPLVEFRLRSVAGHCPTCPHWRGLADRFPESEKRFAVRYMVRCQGEVKQRTMVEIDA